MKALHIISGLDPSAGGPAKAMEGLSIALQHQGVKTEVVCAFPEGVDRSIEENMADHGVSVTRIGPIKPPLGRHPSMKSVMRERVQNADIVHIHGLWEEIQHQAARTAQQLNKPYIIRPCGMLDPWSLRQSWLKKKLYLALRLKKNLNNATAIHFTADEEQKLTAPLNIKAPSIVEPNGLNLSEFNELPPKGAYYEFCPELSGRPYLLFLSRIHHKKGLDLLIPAFANSAPKDTALVVAGPGEHDYIETIKSIAAKHGISDRMILPGMLTGRKKLAAYADAKLFVLPSYQENFGIVIIEALACGTPILTSTAVNIADQLADQPFTFISPAEEGPLTQTLKVACSNLDQLEDTADAAKSFVYDRFDWSAIAGNWHSHYQSLLNRALK